MAVTPDGSRVIFKDTRPGTGFDLMIVSLESESPAEAEPLLASPFAEQNAELSPNGRWLAYQSNESGRDEVYVRPFPDVSAGRWPVSTGGGTKPLWARDGRELFYVSADGRLTAVGVETSGGTFSTGTPVRLLERMYGTGGGVGRDYDVSADGRRFLMVKPEETAEGERGPQLVVVLGFFQELARLAGGGGR